ncbi:hypothetical protein GCM10009630_10110 [Kribbella jejuensis]|uniref:Small integral membrane protein DUF2273 n=1 Tax=Kribbella jejuensis TaxID=236068 RepID=A0A542EAB7_9ACTN|nr:hypothetical protein [Kribbella jejuensis]TQJ12239.1 hypothetical protein FB475_5174 [Kribbella jejuensis]
MSASTVGLFAGLLIAIAAVTGGFLGFLLALVLGAAGFLAGRLLTHGTKGLDDLMARRSRG